MAPTIIIIPSEDTPHEIVLLSTVLEGAAARVRVDEVITAYYDYNEEGNDLIDILDRVLSPEGFVQPAIYHTEGMF